MTVTATQPCQDKETGVDLRNRIGLRSVDFRRLRGKQRSPKILQRLRCKDGPGPANSQDASERAKALFSQYKGVWTEVAAKMQNVKGYPVKSSFTLGLGGPSARIQMPNSANEPN